MKDKITRKDEMNVRRPVTPRDEAYREECFRAMGLYDVAAISAALRRPSAKPASKGKRDD